MNDKSLLPAGAECPNTWGEMLAALTAAWQRAQECANYAQRLVNW